MRRILVLVAGLALPSAAAAQIANSPHNLSSSSTATTHSTTQGQTCVFCHTPHGASTQAALWNHTDTSATAYAGWGETATLNGTPYPGASNGIGAGSRKCLSCHDGATDVGSIVRGGDTLPADWAAGSHVDTTTGAMTGTAVVNVAAMSGNHPVSMPYPRVADNVAGTYNGITTGITTGTKVGEFNTIATAKATGIMFYTDTGLTNGIECGSCHNPHKYDLAGGYRFTNDTTNNSKLCNDCHLK